MAGDNVIDTLYHEYNGWICGFKLEPKIECYRIKSQFGASQGLQFRRYKL